jgi:hypothetical protein
MLVTYSQKTNVKRWGVIYNSVSQPPGRGPVPGPGINYTRPREFVMLVCYAFFMNKYFIVEIS